MLLSLLLNLSMTGGVIVIPPPSETGYYPFEYEQTFSVIEKESQACQKTTINSLNTCNKIIANSLKSCT